MALLQVHASELSGECGREAKEWWVGTDVRAYKHEHVMRPLVQAGTQTLMLPGNYNTVRIKA